MILAVLLGTYVVLILAASIIHTLHRNTPTHHTTPTTPTEE